MRHRVLQLSSSGWFVSLEPSLWQVRLEFSKQPNDKLMNAATRYIGEGLWRSLQRENYQIHGIIVEAREMLL